MSLPYKILESFDACSKILLTLIIELTILLILVAALLACINYGYLDKTELSLLVIVNCLTSIRLMDNSRDLGREETKIKHLIRAYREDES